MSNATAQSLLEALIANPDDDELRLVYADQLSILNDPRGELIQLGCRIEQVSADELPAVVARMAELETQCNAAFPALGGATRLTYERGFIVGVAAHVAVATTRAEELLHIAPLVERLELVVDGQRDRVQLARPASAALLIRARVLTIRGLALGNTLDRRGPIGDLSALATTTFPRLRVLDISSMRIAPPHIIDLLRSPHLPALELLRIHTRLRANERAGVENVVEEVRAARPALQIIVE